MRAGWWSWRDVADDRLAVPSTPARIVLAVAVATYVYLFATWTIHLHDSYATFGFDFGIYDQGLWLLSRFKRPFITFMGRQLFGDHTSFILLFLVPLYWLLPSAHALLIVQAAVLGLAGVPVFLIAREKLRDELLGAALTVAFLLNPALGWLNLEQFHPDVFEVPLLLFAIWFMTRRNWTGFLVCIGLTLLVKEDVVLTTFTLGLVVAFRYDKRAGLIASGMSMLYAATALWWVLPELNGVGSLNGWRVPYGGPTGFVRTAFTDPGEVLGYLGRDNRPWYTWQLLAPLGLLQLLSPSLALVAVGPLAANVVSTFYYQHRLQYHYTAPIIAVFAAATIFGIAHFRPMALRAAAVGVVVASSAFTSWYWGPATWARHPALLGDLHSPMIPSIRAASRLIPRDAAVSSYYGWGTHLDHRARIYDFPVPWRAQNWGTHTQEGQRLPEADTVDYVMVAPAALDQPDRAILDSIAPEFDVIFDEGGVLVLKRHRQAQSSP
ncbi:MAG: hypothetical protein JWO37_2199 [Acidimicrobiales bacterium]|nr:hypothetical protein [Acidimicrobiales bacterium]